MSAEKLPRLMNRSFVLLWQGQTISLLGDQAFTISVALWVTSATGSATLMGLIAMLIGLPPILLGPVAGTAADRFSRRRILVVSDLVSGIAVLLLAAMMMMGSPSTEATVGAIAAAAVAIGVAQAFFIPAISAAIPDLAPASRLPAANSLLQGSAQLSTFAGQAIGGTLFRVLGAPLLLAFDGISFLFAGICESLISIPQNLPPRSNTWKAEAAAVAAATMDGLRFIWRKRGLRELVFASTAMNCFTMPVILLLPFYVKDYLKATPDWYGFLLAGYSLGTLAGYLGAGLLKLSAAGRGRAVLGAMLLYAPAPAVLPLAGSPPAAVALIFAGGLISGFVIVHVTSILQLTTPSEIRGRLFGLIGTIAGGLAPIMMGLAGIIADLLGRNIPLIFTCCGIATGVVVVVLALNRDFRRYLETAGADTPAAKPESLYAK